LDDSPVLRQSILVRLLHLQYSKKDHLHEQPRLFFRLSLFGPKVLPSLENFLSLNPPVLRSLSFNFFSSHGFFSNSPCDPHSRKKARDFPPCFVRSGLITSKSPPVLTRLFVPICRTCVPDRFLRMPLTPWHRITVSHPVSAPLALDRFPLPHSPRNSQSLMTHLCRRPPTPPFQLPSSILIQARLPLSIINRFFVLFRKIVISCALPLLTVFSTPNLLSENLFPASDSGSEGPFPQSFLLLSQGPLFLDPSLAYPFFPPLGFLRDSPFFPSVQFFAFFRFRFNSDPRSFSLFRPARIGPTSFLFIIVGLSQWFGACRNRSSIPASACLLSPGAPHFCCMSPFSLIARPESPSSSALSGLLFDAASESCEQSRAF